MTQNYDDSSSSKRSSLLSLIPTQYIIAGSIILIGLLNMYKGLFRFSYGFIGGVGVGVAIGVTFADSSIGQYILQQRRKGQ
ncbi:unnamed protein product [Rotaria magnacalcarata]|uniref:Uncharacterized protein n=1 Tax=Rotaria magnacalcarata TaxID=392030 RepID=A0A8S2MFC5_9BILA|nr:unnamed protein product [Rotaria magnacalcarata]